MERPGDLMTVKDFAMAAGRSQQAIYKQIGTRLAPYVHEKEGQKYIERRALVEVFKAGAIQPDSTERLSTEYNDEQPVLTVLQTTIDALRDQLAIKDQQIAAQTEQLAQLTAALEHTTASLHAAQALHAGTLQQLLPEKTADPDPDEMEPDLPAEEAPREPEPPKKKTFWQRIFGRR